MRCSRIAYSGASLLEVVRNEIYKILKTHLNCMSKRILNIPKKENINAVCCWTAFLASFRLIHEKERKSGSGNAYPSFKMLLDCHRHHLRWADVVKTITCHDILTITILMILLSMGMGTRLNDTQSNGKPSPNKTNMTNKTQPSKL